MGSEVTKPTPAEAAHFFLAKKPSTFVDGLAEDACKRGNSDVAAWVKSLRSRSPTPLVVGNALDLSETDKQEWARNFLTILGDTGSIMKFSKELHREKVDRIEVYPDQVLKVACAFPTNYPGHVLLVIGEEKAVGELAGSWQVAERFKGQIPRLQLATTDEFDELFMGLVDRN